MQQLYQEERRYLLVSCDQHSNIVGVDYNPQFICPKRDGHDDNQTVETVQSLLTSPTNVLSFTEVKSRALFKSAHYTNDSIMLVHNARNHNAVQKNISRLQELFL